MPDATQLTPRQLDVLRAIRDLSDAEGYPPTVRELNAAVGVASTSTMVWHLEHLASRGFLRWKPGAARTLVLERLAREALDHEPAPIAEAV